MRCARTLSALALIAASGSLAYGVPVLFEVDSEVSVTSIEICETITGSCDTDTSPIAGFIVLDVVPGQDPEQASILHFEFALTQSINLSYNLGFGQTLTINGENLATQYALDGPTGPEPVGPGGELFFPAVALANAGTLSYDTSAILCAILQSQNIPCSETIDLASAGIIDAPIQATLVRDGDFLLLELDLAASFDGADLPDAPPVSGTITTSLQAIAPVPAPECPADVNNSGAVDLADLNLVLGNFGQSTFDGDTNGDGEVDLADLNAVLGAFGTTCE